MSGSGVGRLYEGDQTSQGVRLEKFTWEKATSWSIVTQQQLIYQGDGI